MARQKAASQPAGRPAVKKKWTGHKTAAKSSSRKSIKSKARAVPTAKPRTRPKQRIAISHHRDEDFKADGLRTYAKYRDLGIADATHGLAQAHVIRLVGPCDPAEVSKLHYHDVEFAHQASDHGLLRRRRIIGSDFAGGIQDGRTGDVTPFPSFRATRSVEPGIHNHHREYGFRGSRQRARPGMTPLTIRSAPRRSRPSGRSSACPTRSTSVPAH